MFGKPTNSGVKINCRKCGQPSDSDKFILDPVYKMMVCQNCARERKTAAMIKRSNDSLTASRSEQPQSPSRPLTAAQIKAQPKPQAQLSAASQARASPNSVSAAENRARMEAKLFPSSQPKPKPAEPAKPAGWDEDDLELERLAKYKSSENAPKVERISDDKLKLTCAKCKYRFTYNISSQTPTSCPYCGREIDRPKSY